jgi:hypothetical protein
MNLFSPPKHRQGELEHAGVQLGAVVLFEYGNVRELNLIPIERLLNKFLSTGEEGKDSKEQCAEVGPRLIMWPWQGFGP